MELVPSTNIVIHNKEDFIENVKKWVFLDSKLKDFREKMKKMGNLKNDISDKIHEYATKNAIKPVEINDGHLYFVEKREYTSLSYGFLEKCLHNIIPDKKQVEFIMGYIKEQREVKTSPEIKRTYNK
jgi:hypothetical protein